MKAPKSQNTEYTDFKCPFFRISKYIYYLRINLIMIKYNIKEYTSYKIILILFTFPCIKFSIK